MSWNQTGELNEAQMSRFLPLYSVDLSLKAPFFPPISFLQTFDLLPIKWQQPKKKKSTLNESSTVKHIFPHLDRSKISNAAFFSLLFHLKTRLWYFSLKDPRLQHHPASVCVCARVCAAHLIVCLIPAGLHAHWAPIPTHIIRTSNNRSELPALPIPAPRVGLRAISLPASVSTQQICG